MKRLILLVLATTAACTAPLRGAVHHHPEEIYRNVEAKDGTYSILEKPIKTADHPLIVEQFADRVLAPTGVYLDDWNEHGLLTETYFTPYFTQHLFDKTVAALQKAGFDTKRSYGPAQARDQMTRVLQVEIQHAELHRWAKKAVFATGAAGTIDLARVEYAFRWRDGAGSEISKGKGSIELVLAAGGDDLEAIGTALAERLVAELR